MKVKPGIMPCFVELQHIKSTTEAFKLPLKNRNFSTASHSE